jgi:hypothetical protein
MTPESFMTAVIEDPDEKRALEEQERERARAQRYEELRSEFNSTAVRIRAWEKLHGLQLPTSSLHPVLRVISAATGIPIAAIREEQQLRRDARASQPREGQIEAPATPDIAPDDAVEGQA